MARTPLLLCVVSGLAFGALARGGGVPAERPAAGSASARPAAGAGAAGAAPVVDHAPFDRMLRAHVRDERVDYLVWRKRDGAELDAYLASLATVDPSALTDRAERLAFYLNLYNASMIDAVLERVVDGWSPSEASFGVFDDPRIALGSARITLNALEHEIVRPEFDEPRIHAALVCAAISCPPILPRAYRAEDLWTVLEDNMRRFVRDDRRNTVAGGRARLSEIFKWYAEDFGPEGPLAFARNYRAALPQANDWIPYDWTLNLAAPVEGTWVVLLDAGDGSPAGTIAEVTGTRDDRVTVALPNGRTVARPATKTRPFEP